MATRGKAKRDPRGGDGAAPSPSGAARPTPAEGERGPMRVRRREARARVRAIAAALGGRRSPSAGVLESLADGLRLGGRKGADAVGVAVSRCLDEASSEPPGVGRWALAEAAAWGAGWLGRDAAAARERIGTEVRAATRAVDDGDTRPAAFLVAAAGIFGDPAWTAAAERTADLLAADIHRWTLPSGAPASGVASAFVLRVVGWLRVRESAAATGTDIPWDSETRARLDGAAVSALRVLGDGGRVPVAGSRGEIDTRPLLAVLGERRRSTAVERAKLRRTVAVVTGSRRDARRGLLARDSVEGTVATLRSGWCRGSVRVLFDFGGSSHRLEIASGDRLIVEGPWDRAVEADGSRLEPTGPWEVSCFESDDEATFLEIVAPLADGLQAERQVVLLAADRVLLLVDSVTDGGAMLPADRRPRRLALRTGIPLADAEARAEEETREIRIGGGRRGWRVLPLALPEWRSAHAAGSLDVDGETITLRQDGPGGRITAPLWIDADPERSRKPLTWRQLTVADQRQNLRAHEAFGSRVQVGDEQWLLYRALDVPRNRTVLGCNVACEFLLGRVRPRGEVTRTLEIE